MNSETFEEAISNSIKSAEEAEYDTRDVAMALASISAALRAIAIALRENA